MANPEACELWIDQRTEELNKGGTPFEEIGRIVSAELQDVFKANIKARTIARRARRNAEEDIVTNVTKESKAPEDQALPEVPKLIDSGGQREGAGRKSKPRLTLSEKETIVDIEFQVSFESFFRAIRNAKHLKWKTTSKEAALKHIDVLLSLIFHVSLSN